MNAPDTRKVIPIHRGMPIRQPVDYPERIRLVTEIDEYEARLRGDHYALLLDCYLSGQIPEAAWQEHLRDPGFAAWLEARHLLDDDNEFDGEPISWSGLIGAFALALVAFAAIYFGGHYAVAGLS